MNINRYNYEEYFILYMDNELNKEDRCQVEDFVQKHPDLKEELELLLQYRMEPDTSIVFNDKKELMMHDDITTLTENNYEQWLLLHIDNELSPNQKTSVDQFIATRPTIKAELYLLQSAKLQPEEIIFRDKQTLFRTTTGKPVANIRRWRVAAAAILVLVIGTLAFINLNKKNHGKKDFTVAPKMEQKTIKETPVAITNSLKTNDKPIITEVVYPGDVAKSNQKNSNEITHKMINAKKLSNNIPVIQKEIPVTVINNQQPSNNLPKPLNNPYINNESKDAIVYIAPPKEKINPTQSIPKLVTSNTIQPSQTVFNTSVNNDELNQSGGKKSKLRGFLRKLTRTFEKTTNIDPADDENRLLIGGLTFKLK